MKQLFAAIALAGLACLTLGSVASAETVVIRHGHHHPHFRPHFGHHHFGGHRTVIIHRR